MNIYDYSYRLYRPYLRMKLHCAGEYNEYKTGTYTFELGIVEIYADRKLTTFTLIREGYTYNRTISDLNGIMSDRKLAHQARIFANSITKP